MTRKFKIGDYVRVEKILKKATDHYHMQQTIGHVAIVVDNTKTSPDDMCGIQVPWHVQFVDDDIDYKYGRTGFNARELVKLTDEEVMIIKLST